MHRRRDNANGSRTCLGWSEGVSGLNQGVVEFGDGRRGSVGPDGEQDGQENHTGNAESPPRDYDKPHCCGRDGPWRRWGKLAHDESQAGGEGEIEHALSHGKKRARLTIA